MGGSRELPPSKGIRSNSEPCEEESAEAKLPAATLPSRCCCNTTLEEDVLSWS